MPPRLHSFLRLLTFGALALGAFGTAHAQENPLEYFSNLEGYSYCCIPEYAEGEGNGFCFREEFTKSQCLTQTGKMSIEGLPGMGGVGYTENDPNLCLQICGAQTGRTYCIMPEEGSASSEAPTPYCSEDITEIPEGMIVWKGYGSYDSCSAACVPEEPVSNPDVKATLTCSCPVYDESTKDYRVSCRLTVTNEGGNAEEAYISVQTDEDLVLVSDLENIPLFGETPTIDDDGNINYSYVYISKDDTYSAYLEYRIMPGVQESMWVDAYTYNTSDEDDTIPNDFQTRVIPYSPDQCAVKEAYAGCLNIDGDEEEDPYIYYEVDISPLYESGVLYDPISECVARWEDGTPAIDLMDTPSCETWDDGSEPPLCCDVISDDSGEYVQCWFDYSRSEGGVMTVGYSKAIQSVDMEWDSSAPSGSCSPGTELTNTATIVPDDQEMEQVTAEATEEIPLCYAAPDPQVTLACVCAEAGDGSSTGPTISCNTFVENMGDQGDVVVTVEIPYEYDNAGQQLVSVIDQATGNFAGDTQLYPMEYDSDGVYQWVVSGTDNDGNSVYSGVQPTVLSNGHNGLRWNLELASNLGPTSGSVSSETGGAPRYKAYAGVIDISISPEFSSLFEQIYLTSYDTEEDFNAEMTGTEWYYNDYESYEINPNPDSCSAKDLQYSCEDVDLDEIPDTTVRYNIRVPNESVTISDPLPLCVDTTYISDSLADEVYICEENTTPTSTCCNYDSSTNTVDCTVVPDGWAESQTISFTTKLLVDQWVQDSEENDVYCGAGEQLENTAYIYDEDFNITESTSTIDYPVCEYDTAKVTSVDCMCVGSGDEDGDGQPDDSEDDYAYCLVHLCTGESCETESAGYSGQDSSELAYGGSLTAQTGGTGGGAAQDDSGDQSTTGGSAESFSTTVELRLTGDDATTELNEYLLYRGSIANADNESGNEPTVPECGSDGCTVDFTMYRDESATLALYLYRYDMVDDLSEDLDLYLNARTSTQEAEAQADMERASQLLEDAETQEEYLYASNLYEQAHPYRESRILQIYECTYDKFVESNQCYGETRYITYSIRVPNTEISFIDPIGYPAVNLYENQGLPSADQLECVDNDFAEQVVYFTLKDRTTGDFLGESDGYGGVLPLPSCYDDSQSSYTPGVGGGDYHGCCDYIEGQAYCEFPPVDDSVNRELFIHDVPLDTFKTIEDAEGNVIRSCLDSTLLNRGSFVDDTETLWTNQVEEKIESCEMYECSRCDESYDSTLDASPKDQCNALKNCTWSSYSVVPPDYDGDTDPEVFGTCLPKQSECPWVYGCCAVKEDDAGYSYNEWLFGYRDMNGNAQGDLEGALSCFPPDESDSSAAGGDQDRQAHFYTVNWSAEDFDFEDFDTQTGLLDMYSQCVGTPSSYYGSSASAYAYYSSAAYYYSSSSSERPNIFCDRRIASEFPEEPLPDDDENADWQREIPSLVFARPQLDTPTERLGYYFKAISADSWAEDPHLTPPENANPDIRSAYDACLDQTTFVLCVDEESKDCDYATEAQCNDGNNQAFGADDYAGCLETAQQEEDVIDEVVDAVIHPVNTISGWLGDMWDWIMGNN